MTIKRSIEFVNGPWIDGGFRRLSKIHIEEIDDGFLSTLGPRLLIRLYRTLSTSPHAILIVASMNEDISGFICGSTNTGRVYMDFIKRAGLPALWILGPKLVSVKRLRRVLETLLYPRKKENIGLPESEILIFCVSKNFQRQRVGRALFNALIYEFKKRGVDEIKIVTGVNQIQAQMFYESVGAVLASTITVHKGTPSLIYVYKIEQGTLII